MYKKIGVYSLASLFIFNFLFSTLALADGVKAYEQMNAGKAIMIDIREKDEIKSGMIKGALWLPLSELNKNPTHAIKRLKAMMKDKELFLYCRSGNRVKSFITTIDKKGIKGQNLGGYEDLVSKGLPKQNP